MTTKVSLAIHPGEQTSVTGDTALRLAEVFGTSPEFWMRLQGGYDIALAREARVA